MADVTLYYYDSMMTHVKSPDHVMYPTAAHPHKYAVDMKWYSLSAQTLQIPAVEETHDGHTTLTL